jgi:hypothetical protein
MGAVAAKMGVGALIGGVIGAVVGFIIGLIVGLATGLPPTPALMADGAIGTGFGILGGCTIVGAIIGAIVGAICS